MGRPALHDPKDLLDATASIASARGPAAVSMSAVAQTSGAPSGSLYHRFGNRAGLLGELWVRTVDRFQEGFLAALDGDDPIEACVAAGRHVVRWSRRNHDEAGFLLRGPAEFARDDWPPELRGRAQAANDQVATRLLAIAGLLGEDAHERVILATVDLPYAIVRRHLAAGRVAAHAETLVEETARAILRAS